MKLFVSYRRAAWSFTYWLVEELNKLLDAEIFVDYSGVDETNFEKALLRNLRECDAVLLIVDEHTFAADRIHLTNDWVRREIREALKHHKPIVMACHNGLFPPADLPADIAAIGKVEGIEFYSRYFKAGVNELATFFDRATPIKLRESVTAPTPSPDLAKTVVAEKSNKTLFSDATALAEGGQYDAAITLLRELQLRKYKPRTFSLADVLADVIQKRDAEQRRWEAGEAYDEIAALIRVNMKKAQVAWEHFQADYPEYTDDPAQLASKLMPTGVHKPPTT
jgi:TIR domain